MNLDAHPPQRCQLKEASSGFGCGVDLGQEPHMSETAAHGICSRHGSAAAALYNGPSPGHAGPRYAASTAHKVPREPNTP